MAEISKEVKEILDAGFEGRSKWSEVPIQVQVQVAKLIPLDSLIDALGIKGDKAMFDFMLGCLHSLT